MSQVNTDSAPAYFASPKSDRLPSGMPRAKGYDGAQYTLICLLISTAEGVFVTLRR